ncbi:lipoate--protein ligase family protein [Oceanivirga salmonicida]|uniref:lipoate--protein ligase family protein n=1 Tax=Oceanivirga salmonicida TaxID=1769291 RepID=UPI000A6B3545|nr:protein--protein lipoyl transferase [Oceanivirga salmonicida]
MIELKDLTKLPLYVYEREIVNNEESYIPFELTKQFLLDISHKENYLLLYIWPMQKTVILGMIDKNLPYFEEAKSEIRKYDYEPVVRNIGGLAVVADEGILNFSLFIPDIFDEKISITNAYLIIVDLINLSLSDFNKKIFVGEIKKSYCPGNYDLSIDGKKFAGIAQKRVKKGIVVSIYISVYGNQKQRGEIIYNFYKKGLAHEKNDMYPSIDIDCMDTLSNLLGFNFTIINLLDRITNVLSEIGFKIKKIDGCDINE